MKIPTTNIQSNDNSLKSDEPLFSRYMLWKLIWPLFVEQFLAVTVGAADTMMVSYAGEAAISGVSLVDMINQLIINLFAALATGGAVITSQYLGAGRYDRAQSSVGQLVLLASIFGLAIGIICFVFAFPLLNIVFGRVDEDVFSACFTYLRITSISFPFLAIYNAGAAAFRSTGNSRISMQVSVLMNILNVAGNAIGIFIFHMGVAGVAWPSVISRLVAAIIIIWLNMTGKNELKLTRHNLRKLDIDMSKRILSIGIPSGVENSIFQAGRILVVGIISYFGTVQISANAVANNLDSMFCIPGNAIGLGLITVVGQCIGAKDQKQAMKYTRILLSLAYVVMMSLGLIFFLLRKELLGLYDISDETYALANLMVNIHNFAGMIFWPLAFVLPNSLRASGDARFTMMVSVISMIVFRIGFSYWLGLYLGMGAIGVWISMILDWICRDICFVTRYLKGDWKTKYHPDTA